MAYLSEDGLLYVWQKIKNALSKKVDKVSGKDLSTNDYTTNEKEKLTNIAAGAQVNVIEQIAVNDSALTVDQNKSVNITVPTNNNQLTNGAGYQTSDDVTTAITDAIGEITQFDFMAVNSLPAEGEKGVIYLIVHDHGTNDGYDEYIWLNDSYEKLGHTDIDLSGFLTTNSVISNIENDNIADNNYAVNDIFLFNKKIYQATAAINIGDTITPGTNCAETKADEIFVKNTDYATDIKAGVVKSSSATGISINANGYPVINNATTELIKEGTSLFRPITPSNQYISAFYGLAKAAGDTTQSQSNNTVGTYTDGAKTAIRNMIGAVGSTDYASANNAGIVKVPGVSDSGLYMDASTHNLTVYKATDAQIKAGINNYNPIVASKQDLSVFYGLAKAAGDTTQASSSNAVGTYTDNAKTAIRTMFGAIGAADIPVTDVQIDGTSILQSGVANVPVAGLGSGPGLVKLASGNGIGFSGAGNLIITTASDAAAKNGTNPYTPVTPSNQHIASFYGLAKAAGDTTQSQSSNAVGTYTDEAKASIQHMLGTSAVIAPDELDKVADAAYAIGDVFMVNGKLYKATAAIAQNGTIIPGTNCEETSVADTFVKKTDYASDSSAGIVKTSSNLGVYVNYENYLTINSASSYNVKAGSTSLYPITPHNQHESTFYGLAKAAGDTTQSQSSNAVGTYTSEAKTAIQSMLGIQEVLGGSVVEISESDPVITATPNTQYICGEVATLSFTPYQIGVSDVIFTSGSTPTVLTLPNTVKMPDWFTIEANRVYEINVSNGIYGSVMSWAN